MKIQYSFINPEMISKTEGISVIAGIVQSDEILDDFTVKPFLCVPNRADQSTIGFSSNHDNLLNRYKDYPSDILESPFHHLLKLNIWKSVNNGNIFGEVAFVKTDFPDTPKGQNTYVIFGLVKGDREALKSISDNMYQTIGGENQHVDEWKIERSFKTGVEAKHIIGNNILNVLTQPIWGFEDKKYGISTVISTPLFKKFQENTRHIIEHGVGLPDMRLPRPDSSYVAYLREMDARGLASPAQWLDEGSVQIRSKAALEILEAEVANEQMNRLQDLKKRLEADGPSL